MNTMNTSKGKTLEPMPTHHKNTNLKKLVSDLNKTQNSLRKIIKQQSREINTKSWKLKQGADREKKSDKKILQIELEIIKQREELLHVTRVGKLAEFVSSLAHEISQPLTAIRSYTQAAQRLLGEREPTIREILQHISNDSQRAAMTIKRLRSLLKKSEPEVKPIDMEALIQETMELIMTDAIVRNVNIKTALAAPLPLVRGDRIQLQQVLLNLISNGFEAMDGKIKTRHMVMGASFKNAFVVVFVKDSGCGIPEKNIPKLFSHFFTDKPDGLGMGLAISRSIVEAHGGNLEGKNNAEGGATFSFTLPVGTNGGSHVES